MADLTNENGCGSSQRFNSSRLFTPVQRKYSCLPGVKETDIKKAWKSLHTIYVVNHLFSNFKETISMRNPEV
jgi:hypothetical protein